MGLFIDLWMALQLKRWLLLASTLNAAVESLPFGAYFDTSNWSDELVLDEDMEGEQRETKEGSQQKEMSSDEDDEESEEENEEDLNDNSVTQLRAKLRAELGDAVVPSDDVSFFQLSSVQYM